MPYEKVIKFAMNKRLKYGSRMKRLLIVILILFAAVPVFGENYLLNGGQESQIKYEMVQ